MIITKLLGGIGNQLFQYSAGLVLATLNNSILMMDNYFLLDKSKRYYLHTHRDYTLEMFNISGKLATRNEISLFTVPRLGNKYIYHLKYLFHKKTNVINEDRLLATSDFFQLSDNIYLDGYWQNYEYIRGYEHLLRNEFCFKNQIPPTSKSVLSQILSTNSVGLVVRRGDFINHPEFDIVKFQFFVDGMKLLKSTYNNIYFYIFSDDICWCKQQFIDNNDNIIFVEESHTGPNGEYYLHLLSKCNHFIIPNSTFAWWGAWLSQNKSKTIVAPRKWFKSQKEAVNPIIPKEWITL
jgi:hypothetical protein